MCVFDFRRALCGLLFCVPLTAANAQIIRYVDDDAHGANNGTSWTNAFTGLQSALAAAQSGDQIWVAAGRYVGNFTLTLGVEMYGGFAGTETELTQRDWTANGTILDGNQTGSVVTLPPGATATTRIDGFTITNGSGTLVASYKYGGGLHLGNSSPTIANNTITRNIAGYGGGLYLNSSSPNIVNNTISGNGAFRGGGLYLAGSSPRIANNTTTGNSAFGSGGGLYMYNSSPTIVNNTIIGNSTAYNGYGGGLYMTFSSPTIANNTIAGNSANEYGGGLYVSFSSATIVNNTIAGNNAWRGGGLALADSSPSMANNIVAFNSSGVYRSGGTPSLRYNCVYGNLEYDYSGLTDPAGTDGNISADPRFADEQHSNVHIQPDSPCVGAGRNADAYGDFDIDAQPRIQGGSGTVDIGADESDDAVWAGGPYVIVRVSPAGNDANDGSSWAQPKRTVQAGIDAASALGGEVWVQAGTYEERITLPAFGYVYGGFVGGESERDERDWDANVTRLDGRQQGPVVTARGGHQVSAIDGLTITNGSADCGGGLYLASSSPTISNNTIKDNIAQHDGGGLCLESSFPTIVNNTIVGNSADNAYGGGLYVYYSSPTITNNTITGNRAEDYGGGLYLKSASGTLSNNTITGNRAEDYGGGVYMSYSSPTIVYNRIVGNRASYGGGLYLYSSPPSIANNTITGNSASYGAGFYLSYSSSPTIANNSITGNSGAGLRLSYSASPTITNTIVAVNSAGISLERGYSVTLTLRFNCVSGNTAYNYSGLTDPTGTAGNISADPTFVRNPSDGGDGWGDDLATPDVDEGANDDYGDLQLLSGSPCIDAGDNAAVPADTLDLDGDGDTMEPLPFDLSAWSRFVNDPLTTDTGSGTPPIVDMGAYEYRVEVLGDCRPNGRLDLADFARLGGCMAGPGTDATVECGCADMDLDGDVDLRDFAAFQIGFGPP